MTCFHVTREGPVEINSKLTKGHHIASEGLGRKITHLPPGLQGIHLWCYGLVPSQPSVWKITASPATCCLGHPRQGMIHNSSCGKFSGPSTRHNTVTPAHPWSWPVTRWKLVMTDWSAVQAPQWWQSLALLPNPHEGELAQAPILMRGLVQGSHLDKWCGM
jgi:hypothetical protein